MKPEIHHICVASHDFKLVFESKAAADAYKPKDYLIKRLDKVNDVMASAQPNGDRIIYVSVIEGDKDKCQQMLEKDLA